MLLLWSVSLRGSIVRLQRGCFNKILSFVNGQVARRGLSKTTLLISVNVTSGALLEPFRRPLMYSFNGKCSQFQTSTKVIRDRYRFEKEPNDE